LIRTTENLLSITKFNSRGVVIKKIPEVVEEITGCAVVKFHKAHPDMPVFVDKPDGILFADMDATLIEQVLLNLFENVVYHADGATGIVLKVERVGDRTWIRVCDDGCGIPPAVMPHLFDGKLTANDDRGPDACRSMGIGLSVCYSIIKAHGGDMCASNENDGGAVVSFWLPNGGEEIEY
ncbi:MAG: ATP-binding protein, partial [Clostridia bacterium]|nr:ATP-binding protein [Clostridia bacterium]